MILVMWSGSHDRPRPNGYFLVIAFALIGIFFFPFMARSTDDPARQSADPKMQLIYSLKGEDLFRFYCASCHGVKAEGDGPVAAALNSKVPDLTTIERRRAVFFRKNGLRELIAGDQSVWRMARGRCRFGGRFSTRSKMTTIMATFGCKI